MEKKDKSAIEGFKAVDFMRKTRDEISKDIEDMSYEEIKRYFKKRRTEKAKTKFE